MSASTVAVAHSIVSTDALAEQVARFYSIGRPIACEFLRPGPNDTYLLTTAEGRCIARLYGERWRTRADILYELELLRHLAQKGVPVAMPIPACDGVLACPLVVPEGVRQLALFSYAGGEPLSWENDEHCYQAGQLVAAIHAASDDFTSPHSRFRVISHAKIGSSIG